MNERFPISELALPIRWGDVDALGRFSNTVCLRYMAQRRISATDAVGLPLESTGRGPIAS